MYCSIHQARYMIDGHGLQSRDRERKKFETRIDAFRNFVTIARRIFLVDSFGYLVRLKFSLNSWQWLRSIKILHEYSFAVQKVLSQCRPSYHLAVCHFKRGLGLHAEVCNHGSRSSTRNTKMFWLHRKIKLISRGFWLRLRGARMRPS